MSSLPYFVNGRYRNSEQFVSISGLKLIRDFFLRFYDHFKVADGGNGGDGRIANMIMRNSIDAVISSTIRVGAASASCPALTVLDTRKDHDASAFVVVFRNDATEISVPSFFASLRPSNEMTRTIALDDAGSTREERKAVNVAISNITHSIAKSDRMIILVGAGISTSAGIPVRFS